ncbi:MAG: hypothetical protein ABSC46_08290 [Candidatus Limnocylindrales bacterium]
MVRHVARCVVKFGHYKDWIAAVKAENEAGVRFGMPVYRVYSANVGITNEVFCEAEYESSAEFERLSKVLDEDPEWSKLIGIELSHLVDGSLHHYLLSEVSLD